MKLYKLTLNNFYRYYGEQKIVFSTEKDKNITVLRGENGTGKTTLLNAFYWVMYGDVIKPLTIQSSATVQLILTLVKEEHPLNAEDIFFNFAPIKSPPLN